jgi:predicted nucleotidyltransferase
MGCERPEARRGAAVPASGRLRVLRDELQARLTGLLRADPAVHGAALVGSLGAGRADDWSDIDLLVVLADADVAGFADRPGDAAWARADLIVDARHNAPAGAASVYTQRLRSRLPCGVDIHVYPSSWAAWPADSRVIHEARPVRHAGISFAELSARPPRQPATPKTDAETRLAHLSMVPVAGKYIARRAPAAAPMIRFLGGTTGADDGPAAQLDALRAAAARLADPGSQWLAGAVDQYLRIVRSVIEA